MPEGTISVSIPSDMRPYVAQALYDAAREHERKAHQIRLIANKVAGGS